MNSSRLMSPGAAQGTLRADSTTKIVFVVPSRMLLIPMPRWSGVAPGFAVLGLELGRRGEEVLDLGGGQVGGTEQVATAQVDGGIAGHQRDASGRTGRW